jgi:cytochrome c
MEFLDRLILYPSQEHLVLIRVLVVLLFALHFSFLASYLGGASFSLLFFLRNWREENGNDWHVARELGTSPLFRINVVLLLGILPLFTQFLFYIQVYHETDFRVFAYGRIVLLLALIGFALLQQYSSRLKKDATPGVATWLTGAAGIGLLVVAVFLYVNVEALALFPEKWPFVHRIVPVFVVENVLPRFLLITSLSFAFASGFYLFLYFGWEKRSAEQREWNYLRKILSFAGTLFSLVTPLFLVWHFYTAPPFALSAGAFLFGAATVFLFFVVAILFYNLYQQGKGLSTGRPAWLFVSMLMVVIAVGVHAEGLRDRASREHQKLLALKAAEEHARIAEIREERLAAAQKVDGETIFNQVCATCHRFDSRLVGPPLQEVLPRYRGKEAELISFILSPTRKNPDYPPMPNPGLKKFEAGAVVEYLMKQIP